MASKRRRFIRSTGTRRIRKLILIATEGRVTEPQYFMILNRMNAEPVAVKCINSKKSTPNHVLQRMEHVLLSDRLKRDDEAWIVVDKDDWTDVMLQNLAKWSAQKPNYHLAVSNPMFEYWLLLHFEDGNGIRTANECNERLCRYLTQYRKHVKASDISRDQVEAAIHRAEIKDRPQNADWSRNVGTTVYKLAKSILFS